MFCRPVGLQQSRRHSSEACGSMGKAPPWRPLGAIIDIHRFPFSPRVATGKPSPVAGNIVSSCRLRLSCLEWNCLRLVLDGFTRREFGEAPPWQAGLRFWRLCVGD